MALILLQPGTEPLGQFDGLAALISTVKGGEVLTFGTVAASAQGGAADDADGYLASGNRLVLQLATSGAGTGAPVMLCDDGLLHYGTLFGSVVGGTVGQQVNGPNSFTGAQLGPATAVGSGRLTAWDKPGLYGVTLDALDATLQPGAAVNVSPGAALYAQTTTAFLGTTSNGSVCGHFVEFRSNGSLVTTPNRLVSALNSPSSVVGGVLPNSLFMAVIHFNP